jgi:hypothetical protein
LIAPKALRLPVADRKFTAPLKNTTLSWSSIVTGVGVPLLGGLHGAPAWASFPSAIIAVTFEKLGAYDEPPWLSSAEWLVWSAT